MLGGVQTCQDHPTMIQWNIQVISRAVRLATINPPNRSAPLDGERNNHGNAAENCEKTEAGNMHFSAGDVSRRQQTYLGRAGMKDLRDGRRRKAERSGERREV